MFQKLFVISSYLISLGLALFLFLLGSVSSAPSYQRVEILPGSGFGEIAKNLFDKKIIQSQNTFFIYGIISGSAHQLKPGSYFLSAGSTTPEIIRALFRGPALDKEIVFPEGVAFKDIAAILRGEGILPKGQLDNFDIKKVINGYEFLKGKKNLDGFLFPDTYRFFINSSPEQVIKKFLDNFEKKAFPVIANSQFPISNEIFNAYELLTVASLLEKEAPDFQDRRLIAGVFYKRLKAGIPLQVDATIAYAKCGGAFTTCQDPKVYRKDLEFKSLYNTYLYKGLPPGPIGNPGLDAIKAALNPITSEYLYYLSDPKTKKTIFSKTLEEHIENRGKYLGI